MRVLWIVHSLLDFQIRQPRSYGTTIVSGFVSKASPVRFSCTSLALYFVYQSSNLVHQEPRSQIDCLDDCVFQNVPPSNKVV